MAEPTGQEILMCSLINRGRLNPSGEAARYGIDLDEGPARDFNGNVYTVTTGSKQLLAWNRSLFPVADQHSQDMANAGFLYHDPPQTQLTNMNNAGCFPNLWGENVSESAPITAQFNQTQAIYAQHQSLFVDSDTPSRGHRYNIMLDDYQNVGVGQVVQSGRSWIAQDFGRPSIATQFLTGIAYNDNDNDQFSTATVGQLGLEWQVQDTGHCDGDADADILWLNSNTGRVRVDLTENGQYHGTSLIEQIASDWRLF